MSLFTIQTIQKFGEAAGDALNPIGAFFPRLEICPQNHSSNEFGTTPQVSYFWGHPNSSFNK